jgi:RNA polymerase sigma-70 factor (ECF subfamily)
MRFDSLPDTDELLERASRGDGPAAGQLLQRYRDKLRQMVAVRMDPRLSQRIDPSDVVQEAIAVASQKLDQYLRERPVSFYPWLRRIAWERLVDLHRRHIAAARRSLAREQPLAIELSDQSVLQLAGRLVASGTSPSGRLARKELQARVRTALDQLSPRDREVLVLMYLEQLSPREVGEVLGLGEKAVSMRHLRALQRLKPLLERLTGEGER